MALPSMQQIFDRKARGGQGYCAHSQRWQLVPGVRKGCCQHGFSTEAEEIQGRPRKRRGSNGDIKI